jgi:hypothetical protein
VIQLIEMTTYEEIGGSTIDSYFVEMSPNSGVWTTLQGDTGAFTLNLELTVTGLTTGQTYLFRSKAHNTHGWGDLSSELTVVSSGLAD